MKTLLQSIGIGLVVLQLGACGGGGNASSPPAQTFEYEIDPSVIPVPEHLGTRALGAVQDDAGRTSLFVVDELLINADSQTELDAFLADTGGIVIGNDIVPDPPVSSGINMDARYKQATQYLVKVDASGVNLASFQADAQRAGLAGAARISDGGAARLLALATRERARGYRTSPNFVATGSDYLFKSEEHPQGPGYINALDEVSFDASPTGSRSNVARAWQWVAAKGSFTPVQVAIIDGGFWLDSLGRPNSTLAEPVSDLPDSPLQYDFKDDDHIADGENPWSCTNGSVCKWHGNSSAGVAVGRMNNRYGVAGTGGQVASPMLFKTDTSWDQVARAIRTAVAWRAEVISMSFGMECDNVFCDGYFEFNLYPALRDARDNNVVMVAAAGNDMNDTHKVPCKAKGEGVICVGALEYNTNTAKDYSNYGQYVDILAPTDIRTMPDGDTTPGLKTAGGTSASAPFVAGIAAMLKAFDPTLTSIQVRDILRRTAWTDSTDPKVTHYVNALLALQEVTGAELAPDALESNDASISASNLGTIEVSAPVQISDLSLHNPADRDHFRFTLADYTRLTINLFFVPALGNVNLVLIKEDGAPGSPENYGNHLTANGQGRFAEWHVPPGTYRLVVASDSTNPYDLEITSNLVSLISDEFENNETLATATTLPAPGTGSYRVNLHNLADVDYYRFTQSSNVFQTFRFDVPTRDMPITLRLYNNAGSQINSRECLLTEPCGFAIPVGATGAHSVRVENAGQRGRYTLQALYHINRAQIPVPAFPADPIYMIDAGLLPIPGALAGLRDIYGFVEVGKASRAVLAGSGLKFSLLDRAGNLITAGTPSTDPQLPGATLSLQGLQLNELYLLQIERAAVPTDIDGESAMLDLIPYNIGLSN